MILTRTSVGVIAVTPNGKCLIAQSLFYARAVSSARISRSPVSRFHYFLGIIPLDCSEEPMIVVCGGGPKNRFPSAQGKGFLPGNSAAPMLHCVEESAQNAE